MKIIDTQQHEAFRIMRVNEPYFFPSWHFHPEYEIMLVEHGTGVRFVGDSVERFQTGDLVFYGSNIPHLYRSDREYYQLTPGLISRATVVYFKEDFLGQSFLDLPGITAVKRLFALSKRGIRFKGKARNELRKHILQLDEQKDGISRVIDLLTILRLMVSAHEYDLLSSGAFIKYVDEEDCERMNNVYQFIMDNHTRNPSLEEVAKVAHMSETAFCRYFKTHTNKTYTQFLNEVKIGNACKLLVDNEMSVSQICFEVGFNNFPHFNNQFKKITGLTPSQYQRRHFSPKIG